MAQQDELQDRSYPTGRGYGHDYMRGGEVLGGYGYSERPEYGMRRGELPDGQLQSATEDDLDARRPERWSSRPAGES
jgi:hypothetical protein